MMILNGGAGYLLTDGTAIVWISVVTNSKASVQDSRVVILRDCSLGKVLDFLAHDGNASLIRRVELEHARAIEFWSKHLAAQGQDC